MDKVKFTTTIDRNILSSIKIQARIQQGRININRKSL